MQGLRPRTGRWASLCLVAGAVVACLLVEPLPCAAQGPVIAGRIVITTNRNWVLGDDTDFVTIEVSVSDLSGRPVPDGTEVSLNATGGRLEETTARTENGIARVRFYSGGDRETEVAITAICNGRRSERSEVIAITPQAGDTESGSRNLKISADDYLAFFESTATIMGYGNVRFEFRRIRITAEALQVQIFPPYCLKATGVLLSNGKQEIRAKDLYMEFGPSETHGVANLRDPDPHVLEFVNEDFESGTWWYPEGKFRFWEAEESAIVIKAREILIFPGDKLVLERAKIYYNNVHVLTLSAHIIPLSRAGAEGSAFPQIIGFTYPGGLFIDYPYYFVTNERYTGAVHIRHGSPAGIYTGRRGWYADVDLQYQDQSGGVGVLAAEGIGQRDYGFRWSHYQVYSERTRGSFSLAWPQRRYVSGYANVTTQNRRSTQMISGNWFSARGISENWYVDSSWRFSPVRVGGLGLSYGMSIGVERDMWAGDPYARGGLTAGLRPTRPWKLIGNLTISPRATGEIEQRSNGETELGSVVGVDANLQFSRMGSLGVSYDMQSRQGGRYLNGTRHYVRARLNYFDLGSRPWTLMISATRDLNYNRTTAYGWASWEFQPKWTLELVGIVNRTPNYGFEDYVFGLGRRIGQAQARVLYSTSRHRFEFEFTRATGGLF